MHHSKFLALLFAALCVLCGHSSRAAQVPPAKAALAHATKPAKTVRLLTVGNSFSQNATRYLNDLTKSAGNVLVHQPLVVGGSPLALHWEKAEQHEKDPKAAAPVDPARIAKIRAAAKAPIAIGFGIRTPADAARVAAVADGVVVGTALVDRVAAGDAAGAPARVAAPHPPPIRANFAVIPAEVTPATEPGEREPGPSGKLVRSTRYVRVPRTPHAGSRICTRPERASLVRDDGGKLARMGPAPRNCPLTP